MPGIRLFQHVPDQRPKDRWQAEAHEQRVELRQAEGEVGPGADNKGVKLPEFEPEHSLHDEAEGAALAHFENLVGHREDRIGQRQQVEQAQVERLVVKAGAEGGDEQDQQRAGEVEHTQVGRVDKAEHRSRRRVDDPLAVENGIPRAEALEHRGVQGAQHQHERGQQSGDLQQQDQDAELLVAAVQVEADKEIADEQGQAGGRNDERDGEFSLRRHVSL